MSADATDPIDQPSGAAELSLDDLVGRTGFGVRTIRFYTSRGILPPPVRRGRSVFYSGTHVARLTLIRDLQTHGFTLTAIEGYLAQLPTDAAPESIALHSSLLTGWVPSNEEKLSRRALSERAGRDLSDDDLATLEALRIVRPANSGFHVVTAQLALGVAILDLGVPLQTALAAQRIFDAHGRAIADELTALVKQDMWPAYRDAGESPERVREAIDLLKPVSVAGLVAAFESAADETRREAATRSAVRSKRDAS